MAQVNLSVLTTTASTIQYQTINLGQFNVTEHISVPPPKFSVGQIIHVFSSDEFKRFMGMGFYWGGDVDRYAGKEAIVVSVDNYERLDHSNFAGQYSWKMRVLLPDGVEYTVIEHEFREYWYGTTSNREFRVSYEDMNGDDVTEVLTGFGTEDVLMKLKYKKIHYIMGDDV